MSAERDELANEITTFRERWYGSLGGGSAKEDIGLANHLNGAGYRKAPALDALLAELDARPTITTTYGNAAHLIRQALEADKDQP